jgi:hypothetical protein
MNALGDVVVIIGQESFVLKCTLNAFITIPSHLNGFKGASERLQASDPSAFATVISTATGKPYDVKEHQRIIDLLFENGFGGTSVRDKLLEYVGLLVVGGKVRAEAQSEVAGE